MKEEFEWCSASFATLWSLSRLAFRKVKEVPTFMNSLRVSTRGVTPAGSGPQGRGHQPEERQDREGAHEGPRPRAPGQRAA